MLGIWWGDGDLLIFQILLFVNDEVCEALNISFIICSISFFIFYILKFSVYLVLDKCVMNGSLNPCGEDHERVDSSTL